MKYNLKLWKSRYPLRAQLTTLFRRAQRTEEQNLSNEAVSKVRIAVEWVFGDIVNYFKFLHFIKSSVECRGGNVHSLCCAPKCQIMFLWFCYFWLSLTYKISAIWLVEKRTVLPILYSLTKNINIRFPWHKN